SAPLDGADRRGVAGPLVRHGVRRPRHGHDDDGGRACGLGHRGGRSALPAGRGGPVGVDGGARPGPGRGGRLSPGTPSGLAEGVTPADVTASWRNPHALVAPTASCSPASTRAAGKRRVTVVPTLGVLAMSSAPPWSCISPAARERPRPTPSYLRASEASAW